MRPEHGWPAAASVALLTGLAAAPGYGGVAAVSAAIAIAASILNARPALRPWWTWSAGAAAAVSIAVSVAYSRSGEISASVDSLGYVEMGALLVTVGGLVRRAPVRLAVGLASACAAAIVMLVLRLITASMDVSAVTAGLACAIFSTGTVTAAAAGTYLRLMDIRRHRAVAATRRAQRVELAQDLHDFVAHDVSAIVAQAQAGRLIALHDPEHAADLFARVERAGQRALSSMDQAIDALHGPGAARSPLPGLDELPELAERYSAAGPAQVRLALAPGFEVSREAAATAYRVIVEALTNVRRHAPGATTIDVHVRPAPDAPALEVVITNDSGGRTPTTPRTRRRSGGGLGLAGLTERVHALGGNLTAGPHTNGWQVTAILPTTTRTPQ